ncbi:MAG: 2-oxoacid:acceptor oxidoreductase family protein, partial [Oscillospiraceae bacterium]|nr:2-oxoacid:acceptor oxidoreductase family protein [Oscillospiraceae bacterium]
MTNILLVGVGGQGSIFASRVLGRTAIAEQLNVRGSETIGMAQRGGSVASHLRIAKGEVFSSLIPQGQADVIIA